MSDNVNITPGSGNVVGADEVVDATLGTVKVQYVKLMDGTIDSTNKLVVTSGGAVKTDGSATTQPISASSLPLPTGAATSAAQTTGNTSLSSIDGKVPTGLTVTSTRLLVDASGTTQPVSGTVTVTQATGTNLHTVIDSGTLSAAQSGTWNITNVSGTVSLPTGASTAAKQPALGTAGTASTDVLTIQGIASMTPLKVDASGTTQPVSGTVTVTQSTGTNLHTVLDSGTLTSITNALPAGTNVIGHVIADSGSTTAVTGNVTVVQATAANLNATVTGTVAATQSGTWNVNNISGTVSLPTGASTSALQTTGNTSLASIDSKLPVLGSAATAASVPVTQATDSATGTLGALNATVQCVSVNAGTALVQVSGTWVGTITFEGSNDSFATSQAITSVYLGGLATQSASITINGFFSVLSAGFAKVQARMSAYTSGTATIAINTETATRVIVPIQGNPNNNQSLVTQGAAGASAWKVDGSAVTQPVSGSVTVTQATGTNLHAVIDSGAVTAVGTVADNSSSTAGAPVMVGGTSVAPAADPGSVSATGNIARVVTDSNRRILICDFHPNLWNANDNQSTPQTNNVLKAAPGASLSLYITDILVSNGATAGNIKFVEDPAGTPVTKIPPLYLSANAGASKKFATPIRITANKAFGYTSTSVTTHSVLVTGFIAP